MSENSHMAKYNNNYFLFVVIGIGMLDLISVLLTSSIKTIRSAQTLGFIDMTLNSKIPVQYFLVCGMLYPSLIGLIKFFCYLFVAYIFMQFELTVPTILLTFVVFILTIAPFAGLGLITSAFVLIYKQGQPINALINLGLLMFAGILFPVSVLPNYLQAFSFLIPTTHGIELVRQLIIYNAHTVISFDIIAFLTLTSLISILLGMAFVTKALRKVKIDGSSGRY